MFRVRVRLAPPLKQYLDMFDFISCKQHLIIQRYSPPELHSQAVKILFVPARFCDLEKVSICHGSKKPKRPGIGGGPWQRVVVSSAKHRDKRVERKCWFWQCCFLQTIRHRMVMSKGVLGWRPWEGSRRILRGCVS